MPAVAQTMQLTAGQLAMWAALLVAAVAVMVHLLRRDLAFLRIAGNPEPDSVFWDAFGGAVVILPAMLIPSLASPPAGLLLLVLGAATAVCVVMAGRQLDIRQSRQPWRQPGYADAEAVHGVLLARWSTYEIDPAKTIMFPAMTDVRIPQTAELIRAMRNAELCRATVGADYPAAVERFGRALKKAELAAGVRDGE